MQNKEQYKGDLSRVIDALPDEKVAELIDFAKYLASQYAGRGASSTTEASLLMQQRTLNRIWDHPEEDVYEL